MNAHPPTEGDIFGVARQIASVDARLQYIDHVCGDDLDRRNRILRLLDEDKRDSFLEKPLLAPAATIDRLSSRETDGHAVGPTVGPYKLLQQIGEGGFGIVHMAEQQHPVRRKVALKVIKPGMDTKEVIGRFEAERQALAMMDHPNIAKVLDAGTTESGRPYFVMELVKGIPITDYCDRQRLGTRERLELFVKVCHAVQHAHQKGVIHRDIKPTNVLVTEHDGTPVPKVIDFGVAKAINQQLTERTLFTRFQQMVGTPMYMSPEQADLSGLDIDTRSDIYSLGVLLYELLTGTTPFDKQRFSEVAYDEIRRLIREEEPPLPSTRISSLGQTASTVSGYRRTDPKKLSQLMRGELDWVIMKAMDKDRKRRYETANSFAIDIQRFLDNEPVSAAAPSAVYLFRKFARRNTLAIAVTAAIAASLLIGLGAATFSYVRERDARAVSERRRQEADLARSAAEANERIALEARLSSYRNLYVSDMRSALLAWEDGDVTEVRNVLNRHLSQNDQPDLRGFEWYHLQQCLLDAREVPTFSHSQPVMSVALSPDGRTLAAASGNLIHVWDVRSCRKLRELKGHGQPVISVAFSPMQNDRLASAGDTQVKLWDVSSGAIVATVPGPRMQGSRHLGGSTGCLAFSPNGKWLAACGGRVAEADFIIWHAETLQEDYNYATAKEAVGKSEKTSPIGLESGSMLTFSPDSKTVAIANRGNDAFLFDVKTREFTALQRAGHGHNYAVTFSPDGSTLVCTGHDIRISVWNLTKASALEVLESNQAPICSARYSPVGRYFATTENRMVRLWDMDHRRVVATFRGHDSAVLSLAYSLDGSTLASGSASGEVKLWKIGANPDPDVIVRPDGQMTPAATISPDGKSLASSWNGLHVWDLAAGSLQTRNVTDAGWAVDYSSNGQMLAMDLDVGDEMLLWDAQLWQERARLKKPIEGHNWVHSIVFSPDDIFLATGTWPNQGGSVIVWDLQTREPISVIQPENEEARFNASNGGLAFSPDSRMLAIPRQGFRVALWDVNQQQVVGVLDGHTEKVRCVAFSVDSDQDVLLATAEWDRIIVWDVATRRRRTEFFANQAGIRWLAFAPDGTRLASSGNDGSIKLWSLELNREVVTLREDHGPPAGRISFSRDGCILAAGRFHPTIRLWRAAPSDR